MIKRTHGFLPTWKMALLTGGLTLGVAVAPYMAQAQDAPGFSEIDQNVDGVVSEDEFLMAMPDATAETFASADVNGDTVLTQEEYEAVAAMMQ